jgi:hypothetical protein
LWEQHYAYYITGVGINLLLEAAGGGSAFMFGMASFMREIKATLMNIYTLCVIIVVLLGWKLSNPGV